MQESPSLKLFNSRNFFVHCYLKGFKVWWWYALMSLCGTSTTSSSTMCMKCQQPVLYEHSSSILSLHSRVLHTDLPWHHEMLQTATECEKDIHIHLVKLPLCQWGLNSWSAAAYKRPLEFSKQQAEVLTLYHCSSCLQAHNIGWKLGKDSENLQECTFSRGILDLDILGIWDEGGVFCI